MFSPYDFLWGHKMDRTPARERKSRVIREYCAACGIVESLPLQPKLFNPQGRRRRRRRSWNNIRCTLKTSRRTGPFLVYVIFSQIARWDGNRLLIEGVTSLGRRGRTRQFVASTMARCLRIGIATHVRCFAIRVDDEHKFSRFGRGGPSCVFSSFFALVGDESHRPLCSFCTVASPARYVRVKAKYEIIVALIVLATQGSTQIILWGNSLLLLLLQKKKKNMLSSRQQRHSASAPCRNILTNESFRLFF